VQITLHIGFSAASSSVANCHHLSELPAISYAGFAEVAEGCAIYQQGQSGDCM